MDIVLEEVVALVKNWPNGELTEDQRSVLSTIPMVDRKTLAEALRREHIDHKALKRMFHSFQAYQEKKLSKLKEREFVFISENLMFEVGLSSLLSSLGTSAAPCDMEIRNLLRTQDYDIAFGILNDFSTSELARYLPDILDYMERKGTDHTPYLPGILLARLIEANEEIRQEVIQLAQTSTTNLYAALESVVHHLKAPSEELLSQLLTKRNPSDIFSFKPCLTLSIKTEDGSEWLDEDDGTVIIDFLSSFAPSTIEGTIAEILDSHERLHTQSNSALTGRLHVLIDIPSTVLASLQKAAAMQKAFLGLADSSVYASFFNYGKPVVPLILERQTDILSVIKRGPLCPIPTAYLLGEDDFQEASREGYIRFKDACTRSVIQEVLGEVLTLKTFFQEAADLYAMLSALRGHLEAKLTSRGISADEVWDRMISEGLFGGDPNGITFLNEGAEDVLSAKHQIGALLSKPSKEVLDSLLSSIDKADCSVGVLLSLHYEAQQQENLYEQDSQQISLVEKLCVLVKRLEDLESVGVTEFEALFAILVSTTEKLSSAVRFSASTRYQLGSAIASSLSGDSLQGASWPTTERTIHTPTLERLHQFCYQVLKILQEVELQDPVNTYVYCYYREPLCKLLNHKLEINYGDLSSTEGVLRLRKQLEESEPF